MEIEIIKSCHYLNWYDKKIGEKFTVCQCMDDEGDEFYQVDDPESEDFGSTISKQDCKIINQ